MTINLIDNKFRLKIILNIRIDKQENKILKHN